MAGVQVEAVRLIRIEAYRMCRRRRTFTRRNCANWVKMFSDDPQQAFPAPRPMMSKHKSLEPLRKWLQNTIMWLTALMPPGRARLATKPALRAR